MNTVAVTMSRG